MNVWQKGTSPNHSLVQVCCKASFFITSCIWQNVLNVWKMALCRPHIFLFKVYRVGGTAIYHKISSNYHSSKKLVPCLFLSGPLLHFRFHLLHRIQVPTMLLKNQNWIGANYKEEDSCECSVWNTEGYLYLPANSQCLTLLLLHQGCVDTPWLVCTKKFTCFRRIILDMCP